MFTNLKYFKPACNNNFVFFFKVSSYFISLALKENPKFEINEEVSEQNEEISSISLSMECDKKQRRNNNFIYLRNSELIVNLFGNECLKICLFFKKFQKKFKRLSKL